MKKVIYFSASWCQPCVTFGPLMDRVIARYPVEYQKAKVDSIFEDRALAGEYNVMSLPSVVFLTSGKQTSGFSGAKSEKQLVEWLDLNV